MRDCPRALALALPNRQTASRASVRKSSLCGHADRRIARSASIGVIAMSDKPVRREFVVESALHGVLIMLVLITLIMGAAWALGA